jgi:hypothetical protein
MGIFSKLWKGVKKTFKKIFKPIKKVFKGFGKFMNKIGIIGQIAMSFILPGIGTALSGMFSGMVSSLAAGSLGTIGKAAGWVLGKAGQFAKTISTGFKTVTSAVTDFIGATGKYVGGKLGKMGIGTMKEITFKQAFGAEGWAGNLVKNFSKFTDSAKGLFTDGLSDFASKGIMTPAEIAARQEIPVEDLSTQAREIDGGSLQEVSNPIDGRAAPQEVINPADPTTSMLAPRDNAVEAYNKMVNDNLPLESSYTVDSAGQRIPASSRFNPNAKNPYLNPKGVSAPTPPSTTPPIKIPDVASSTKKSLFERFTGEKTMEDFTTKLPGKTLQYGVDTIKGIPGQMVQGQLMSLIQGEPDPYEQDPLWGGSTYAYQSFDYNQLAGGNSPLNNFENYTAFNDYNNMYNNEPRGQYGGIDAFNAFSQRGTA